jgi:hypothetical protein
MEENQKKGRFNFVISDWKGEQFRNLCKINNKSITNMFEDFVDSYINNWASKEDNLDIEENIKKLKEMNELINKLTLQKNQLDQQNDIIRDKLKKDKEELIKIESEKDKQTKYCFKCGGLIENNKAWKTKHGLLCRSCYLVMPPKELGILLRV